MAIEKVVELKLSEIDTTLYAQRHLLGTETWNQSVGSLAHSLAINGQNTPAYVVPRKGLETPESIETLRTENPEAPIYDLVFGHRRFAALLELQRILKDKTDNPELVAIRAACKARGAKGDVKIKVIVHDRPSSESDLWTIIVDENSERESFTPTEAAEAEAKLKQVLASEGKITTKDVVLKEKPTYGEFRAKQTGKSARTIENQVALGEADATVRAAVNGKSIALGAAYALVTSEDNDVQKNVIAYIVENEITVKTPADIKSIIGSIKGIQPDSKSGVGDEDNLPDVLGQKIDSVASFQHPDGEHTDEYLVLEKDVIVSTLRYYASTSNYGGKKPRIVEDGGSYARRLLKAIGATETVPTNNSEDEYGEAPKPEYVTREDGVVFFANGTVTDKDGVRLAVNDYGQPYEDTETGDWALFTGDDEDSE